MPDQRLAVGLLLTLGACTRVPADVSTPSSSDPGPRSSAEAIDPLSPECHAHELKICADSCKDGECLEWCGGQSCVDALTKLWSCMDEAERRFVVEHPEPPMVFDTWTDAHGETYSEPTAESIERQLAWDDTYYQMLEDHWTQTCERTCAERLVADESGGFCQDWQLSYFSWRHLTQPPTPQRMFADPSFDASLGLWGALGLGTTAALSGELASRRDDPRIRALAAMIRSQGMQLGSAEACVPGVTDAGREFVIAVELDSRGAVIGTELADRANAEDACLANLLASTFTLPRRVAREFPRLDVHVIVKPRSHGLGGLDGWGLEDWGLDSGDMGGLGGAGRGGEATVGSGGIGTIGD